MTRIENLIQRKKDLKMTLQQIADLSNIPKRTVDDIFSGHTKNPRNDTLESIENALSYYEQGVRPDATVKITPIEDEILVIFREIGRKFGTAAQMAYIQLGESILQNFNLKR